MLFARSFRYRVNVRNLPESPDIVLPKYRIIIFIHGCFWHGHDCKNFRIPKTRPQFWADKIVKNRIRNQKSIEELECKGWRVRIEWECRIKEFKKNGMLNTLIDEITKWILSEND